MTWRIGPEVWLGGSVQNGLIQRAWRGRFCQEDVTWRVGQEDLTCRIDPGGFDVEDWPGGFDLEIWQEGWL